MSKRAAISRIMIGVGIVGVGLLYLGVTSENDAFGVLGACGLIGAIMWFGHNDSKGRERPRSNRRSHNPALGNDGGADGCD